MKTLLYGIFLIILIGFGGLVYRNAIEHPNQPIACPMDAKVCPDGTAVARTGLSCTFAECPPPNISFADIDIAYAIPEGFSTVERSGDPLEVATYQQVQVASSTGITSISIVRIPIAASSTALTTIQGNALSDPSGQPIPVTSFTSSIIGAHRFTIARIGRFEGQIDTAYYLVRTADVLRFDALDYSSEWMNSNLDIASLPAHKALVKLLGTLQGF